MDVYLLVATKFSYAQATALLIEDNEELMKSVFGRYFECQPKFGLFAPAHKVSRSPSSRRPSASCAIHHGTAGPGIKRIGSRESVVSASSAASSVRGPRVRLGVTSLSKTVQQVG